LLFRGKEIPAGKEIATRVQSAAEKKGLTTAQVAMGWVFSKDGMVSICGLKIRSKLIRLLQGESYLDQRGAQVS
jgi:aryl-alcohol dehydrogenase-like predicted oxidoreductase